MYSVLARFKGGEAPATLMLTKDFNQAQLMFNEVWEAMRDQKSSVLVDTPTGQMALLPQKILLLSVEDLTAVEPMVIDMNLREASIRKRVEGALMLDSIVQGQPTGLHKK